MAKEKGIEMAVAQAMAKQAAQQRGAQSMQVMQNGGVNQAVNFASEDFAKAALVLKHATNSFATAHGNLPAGMQSFVNQQFFRMNAAGLMLDALGYQAVTEMLAHYNPEAIQYIQVTMQAWNALIEAEGDVKKMYDAIEAEEKAKAEGSVNIEA